ncbi:hypothetical protein ACXYTJ_14715 [Gilvimarinus sp. F26214L]|uniref:hypothetical protein n=1 Tax=Gilvimarinus sp. DZF01 TaxID=3461371 RepID=UPI0040465D36
MTILRELFGWAQHNEHIIAWLAGSSALVMVVSLMLIPWAVLRIPSDYFLRTGRRSWFAGNPVLVAVVGVFRNVLGVLLMLTGVALLVLPGQGLLTIFLGIVIADFPGKHRLMNWLVAHPGIHRPMNWWRGRAGREAIQLPPRSQAD